MDADACPVREEVYRVARRHDLKVYVVARGRLRVPDVGRVERVRVADALDAADDWIASHAGEGDVVITTDLPLAARCLRRGARVLAPDGRTRTEETIGDALATRDLLEHLRAMGEDTSGPKPFAPRDRERFLVRLEQTVREILG